MLILFEHENSEKSRKEERSDHSEHLFEESSRPF